MIEYDSKGSKLVVFGGWANEWFADICTLDVAHEKYYEQLGHPKARVDGTPPTDDVVAAVVAAARALGAPLGGEPARKTPSAERA